MDRKNLIAIIAGCLAILLLICILLVGILDNIWPWDGVTAYGRLITGRTQNTIGPKETTAPTEEATLPAPPSGNAQQDPEKPTVGEIGQKPVPPTLPGEDEEIKDEVGGIVIGPTGSTGATGESTDTTGESTGATSGGATDPKDHAQLDASDIPGW